MAVLLLTAAQSGMLKYVRDAGVIWWISLEANREDVIFIVPCHVYILGSGFLVAKMQSCEL